MIRLLIGSRSYDLADPTTAGGIRDRPVIPTAVAAVAAASVAADVVVCCGSPPLRIGIGMAQHPRHVRLGVDIQF